MHAEACRRNDATCVALPPRRLNQTTSHRAQGACPLDSGANLIPLFYLSDVKDAVFEYKNGLKDIVQDYEGGEFSLFFTNCEPLSAVSFDLQVGCRPSR